MEITEFIKLNNFESLCREKKTAVKRDGDYMLLKYEQDADFTDAIVKAVTRNHSQGWRSHLQTV